MKQARSPYMKVINLQIPRHTSGEYGYYYTFLLYGAASLSVPTSPIDVFSPKVCVSTFL